jgi:uncharacterized membrane protein YfcA
MGGGILLMGVMATMLPPAVVIPVHGLVQLASNGSRAVLSWNAINWKIVWPFGIGALVGAAVGGQFAVSLPEDTSRIVLALFILAMTWVPTPKAAPKIPGKFFWVGMGSTFLSMFIGATGPLQAPFFLRDGLTKDSVIATKAATQVFQHITKVVAFIALGFAVGPFLPLIGVMIVAVILGSYAGKLVLNRVPEKLFFWFFKITITALAIHMLIRA